MQRRVIKHLGGTLYEALCGSYCGKSGGCIAEGGGLLTGISRCQVDPSAVLGLVLGRRTADPFLVDFLYP